MNKSVQKIIFDLVMIVGFLCMFNTRATGLAIHELAGLIIGILMFIHIGINWHWFIAITKKFLSKLRWKVKLSYVLAMFLLAIAVVFMGSGLLISEVIMPLIGIKGYLFVGDNWTTIHAFAGRIAFLIIVIHTFMHWTWIKRTVKKMGFSKKVTIH
ncbi:MAG: hypothetical protein ACI35O_14325 [Bacillaceae bacterium]